jgi:hypothetical protein
MRTGLMLGFLAFTLLAITLLWLRARIALSAARLSELEQEALEVGVDED